MLVLLFSWVRNNSWEKKSVQLRDVDDDLLDVSIRVPIPKMPSIFRTSNQNIGTLEEKAKHTLDWVWQIIVLLAMERQFPLTKQKRNHRPRD